MFQRLLLLLLRLLDWSPVLCKRITELAQFDYG